MYSIYPRANLVTKSYDGCAMGVVFSRLQNCADFSNGDFRDGGSAFQHMGPETANVKLVSIDNERTIDSFRFLCWWTNV